MIRVKLAVRVCSNEYPHRTLSGEAELCVQLPEILLSPTDHRGRPKHHLNPVDLLGITRSILATALVNYDPSIAEEEAKAQVSRSVLQCTDVGSNTDYNGREGYKEVE